MDSGESQEMAHLVTHSSEMGWEETSLSGVSRKVLAHPAESGLDVSLMRLRADTAMPTMDTRSRMELFVVDGTYTDESGDHPAGSYIVYPPAFAHTPASRTGCVLFIRRSID